MVWKAPGRLCVGQVTSRDPGAPGQWVLQQSSQGLHQSHKDGKQGQHDPQHVEVQHVLHGDAAQLLGREAELLSASRSLGRRVGRRLLRITPGRAGVRKTIG